MAITSTDVQIILELARDFPDANTGEIAAAMDYAALQQRHLGPNLNETRRIATRALEAALDYPD